MLTKQLIQHVQQNFKLDLKGIHGTSHWARVCYNGRLLQYLSKDGDLAVIELFAFIHDSQRLSDSGDEEHGPRAAVFAIEQNSKLFNLNDYQLEKLVAACNGHTAQLFHDDLTVQICWDSDRLDIGRCKTHIDPAYLGTKAAKLEAVQRQALARSRANIIRL